MYHKTQYASTLLVIFILCLLFLYILYFFQIGNNPVSSAAFTVFTLIFIAIGILFYKMTTIVTKQEIKVVYGIGVVRFNFKIDKLTTVEITKTPWYYGWGIRYTPEGWLYNISNLCAVRITYEYNGSGKTVTIGTPDPENLREAIKSAFISNA